MQKDELIQLHTLLLQLRTCLERENDGHAFEEYERLAINPYHVYKSKREHKLAVFILGKGIARMLSHRGYPGFDKLSSRLDQMARRFKTSEDL
jgi:hypothetical protein